MNQQYIKTPVTRRGKIKLRKVQNIGLVKGVKTFLLDQQYAFQCAPMGDTEASMTVIRMTIPKGTAVMQGYTEVYKSLAALGYDPYKVLKAMGFEEVIYGSEFCSQIVGKESCTECGEGRGCTGVKDEPIRGIKANLIIMDDLGCRS